MRSPVRPPPQPPPLPGSAVEIAELFPATRNLSCVVTMSLRSQHGEDGMRVLLALALVAGGLVSAGSVAAQGEGDMEKIQGAWSVAEAEKAGQPVPAEALKDAKLVF